MYRHWLRIKHTSNTTAKVAVCLRFTLNLIFSYNIMLIYVDCTSMLLNWNPSEIGDLFIYVRSLTKNRIDVTLIYGINLPHNFIFAHIFYLLYISIFSLKLLKRIFSSSSFSSNSSEIQDSSSSVSKYTFSSSTHYTLSFR